MKVEVTVRNDGRVMATVEEMISGEAIEAEQQTEHQKDLVSQVVLREGFS